MGKSHSRPLLSHMKATIIKVIIEVIIIIFVKCQIDETLCLMRDKRYRGYLKLISGCIQTGCTEPVLLIPNSHYGLHEIRNVGNPVSFWFVVAQCRCVFCFSACVYVC